MGGASRSGRVAARRPSAQCNDGLRRHRVDRPSGPTAGPLGRRAVLPADGRGPRRHRCDARVAGAGVLPPGPEPSLVIAAGITVLRSGLSVVGAVPDAISGFYVTAAGRAAEIALLSAGLLAVGLSLDPAGAVAADVTRLGISTCAAAAAAVMFSLACYAPVRALSVAGLTGGAGWAAYGCLTLFAHAGPVYLRASRRRWWGSRPRFRGAAR